MRRMALDWTLSRRQRVDFGAPPQTWELYRQNYIPKLYRRRMLPICDMCYAMLLDVNFPWKRIMIQIL